MIKNVLTHIDGIGVYGILSICIFLTVFAGMLVWTFCLKDKDMNRMSQLPLDDGGCPDSSRNELKP